MKSLAFIVPWGGKLPSYFQLWLESCRWNPSVDFFIFTDDKTYYNYPDNVKVHYMTFDQMKALFKKNMIFQFQLIPHISFVILNLHMEKFFRII